MQVKEDQKRHVTKTDQSVALAGENIVIPNMWMQAGTILGAVFWIKIILSKIFSNTILIWKAVWLAIVSQIVYS